MPARPQLRRLLAIVAVAAFIVLGNVYWDPARIETVPTPTPNDDDVLL